MSLIVFCHLKGRVSSIVHCLTLKLMPTITLLAMAQVNNRWHEALSFTRQSVSTALSKNNALSISFSLSAPSVFTPQYVLGFLKGANTILVTLYLCIVLKQRLMSGGGVRTTDSRFFELTPFKGNHSVLMPSYPSYQ